MYINKLRKIAIISLFIQNCNLKLNNNYSFKMNSQDEKQIKKPKIDTNDLKIISMIENDESNVEKISLILKTNKIIDEVNIDGKTALILSIHKKMTEVVNFLLKSGANADIFDNFGKTALMYAAEGNYKEVIPFLLTSVKDINARSQDGEEKTALMYASANEGIDSVEILLENNADPNIVSNEGLTALGYVYNKDGIDIASMLLEKGADPNLGSSSLLAYAMQMSRVEFAKLILEKGADASKESTDLYPIVVLAAMYKDPELMELILKGGADPNTRKRTYGNVLTEVPLISIPKDEEYSKFIELFSENDLYKFEGAVFVLKYFKESLIRNNHNLEDYKKIAVQFESFTYRMTQYYNKLHDESTFQDFYEFYLAKAQLHFIYKFLNTGSSLDIEMYKESKEVNTAYENLQIAILRFINKALDCSIEKLKTNTDFDENSQKYIESIEYQRLIETISKLSTSNIYNTDGTRIAGKDLYSEISKQLDS